MRATRVQCSLGSRSSFKLIPLLLAGALCAADDRLLFERARALEQAADLPGAEAAYRAYLQQSPASAEALGNLGVVLARQSKYEGAAAAYRQALRIKPSLIALRLNLGLAYYKMEKPELAAGQLQLYLKRDPANRQARQLLATSLLETDRFVEAAGIFESLLPAEEFSVRLGLATAYVKLGRSADAQRLLAQLLGGSESPEAQVVLGQALLAENKLDEAEAAFRKALDLNPALAGVHFLLGAVKWKGQEIDDAIAEWRAEAARDPAHFEAVFALGAALAEKGDADEARAWLEKAAHSRPNHGSTLYYLGKLAWKEKRPEAGALLERSLRLDPNNRAAHYLLSQIYRLQGRVRDAERELLEVKRLSEASVREDVDILQRALPRSR